MKVVSQKHDDTPLNTNYYTEMISRYIYCVPQIENDTGSYSTDIV